MKINEIITENQAGVRQSRLREFRDDDGGRRDGGGGEDPDFHSRGSWKLDTRHYNQAIDFYSLFGPTEYQDRWIKDPKTGEVTWEGWQQDDSDHDALGRSIPGELRKMAGFRWDNAAESPEDDAPGTGWYYAWSPDWGDIFKRGRDLEEWRPDRAWCEKTPVRKQGASNTSSCRSQGFTARDSEVRVRLGRAVQKIGDRRIKGRKYGGPLPDYSD